MKRRLFEEVKAIAQPDLEKLVAIQAEIMANQYGATCFDVKQLQRILGVGETNVYQLLKSGKLPCQTIGRRKVVPVVALAQYLVKGEEKTS